MGLLLLPLPRPPLPGAPLPRPHQQRPCQRWRSSGSGQVRYQSRAVGSCPVTSHRLGGILPQGCRDYCGSRRTMSLERSGEASSTDPSGPGRGIHLCRASSLKETHKHVSHTSQKWHLTTLVGRQSYHKSKSKFYRSIIISVTFSEIKLMNPLLPFCVCSIVITESVRYPFIHLRLSST